MKFTPTSAALFFKGRPGDPRLGEIFSTKAPSEFGKTPSPSFIIIGAPDDTGVIANRGRPGAKGGPDGIRSAFYKFAVPAIPQINRANLIDGGNIIASDQIITTHERSFELAQAAATSGATLIALGGGHDFAAPHILGAFSGIATTRKNCEFGVINIDPHLDVRELENGKPHSGTPFRQIVESGKVSPQNIIQFGARIGRNASAHFDYCKSKKIKVMEFAAIKSKGDTIKQFKTALTTLSRACDNIAITIDMDCCSDSEGVSAAAVIGFSAWEICQFAFLAGSNPRVKMLEIAEVAPELDPTGRTCRIAAETIFHFMLGRLSSPARAK